MTSPSPSPTPSPPPIVPIDVLIGRAVWDALEATEGDIRAAGLALGVGQGTIYRWVKQYGWTRKRMERRMALRAQYSKIPAS